MTRQGPFLAAAGVTLDLLGRSEVAAAWSAPSALPEMSVGALAHHLGSQVLSGLRALTDSGWAGRGETVSLVEHYRRSAWVGADLDAEPNVAVREGSATAAARGHQEVLAEVRGAVAALDPWPPDAPETVSMPHWSWSMATDDFLVTRMMEMVVHADDLAVGLGLETPVFPPEVARPVFGLLVAIAEDQHGQAAVTRALTRSERAGSIVVF